jgi:hypothetical protein
MDGAVQVTQHIHKYTEIWDEEIFPLTTHDLLHLSIKKIAQDGLVSSEEMRFMLA